MTFPNFSPHLSHLAELEEHAEKGVEILRSIVGSTRIISLLKLIYIFTSLLPCEAPISALNPAYSEKQFSFSLSLSLLFSLAKHPFQFLILHTLKANISFSLSLSSLLEKKDVVSQPNSKSKDKINAASQPDSTTKQDYS